MSSGFLTIAWADAEAVDQPCPNCGASGPKPRVLGVSWIGPRRRKPLRRGLFFCPVCSCRYFEPMRLPDYHDWLLIGWPELHAQQGAGLWSIDSPVARIRKPQGARFLEVGCGYGYALDFASHAKGWRALGIDPAPLSELGCRLLGAELRSGYFPEADPEIEPWDVMAATEVIEHVAAPLDLLRQMRARLADDGVLLLTTPDGEAIRRETPEAALTQLLAPELHMVFQTKASLAQILAEAGFNYVTVERDATSLVAFASPAPLDLDDDIAARRLLFVNYLATRARQSDISGDVGLGFAARAMAEAVNDGDFELALEMRGRVWSGIETRFGLDLDRLDRLPKPLHRLPLQRLRLALPFNLATILFAEAMRRLGTGAHRAEVRRELALSAEAADLLIRALAGFSLNDGMTEEIAWQARAELVLADADAGDAAAVPALRALPSHDQARHRQIAWRTLIALVNGGAAEAARDLAAQEHLNVPGDALPAPLRHDCLVVLGQLALAPGGDPADAVAIARQLDEPAAGDLLLGAFSRLVDAGRYEEAAFLRDETVRRAALRRDDAGRDACLALAMLDLEAGDPAAVPSRLQGLDIAADQRAALLLAAFTRLVNTSRYPEALAFADDHHIAATAMARRDNSARDARLALAVLDLAAGDPADVPSRLKNLGIAADQRAALLLAAFTRLVNAARYDDAQDFAAAHAIEALAIRHDFGGAREARLALARLDLAAGDPARVPARLEGLDLDPPLRAGLLLGAFTRLVNASRYDDAQAFARAHDAGALALARGDEVSRDARLALAVLDLAAGDPARVASWIEGLDIDDARRRDLLLAAFTRLVNASRFKEAAAMPDIAGLAMRESDDAGRDARLALAVLDLAAGDPAAVPARLAGLDVEADRRAALLLAAFTGLVNASRFDEALALEADHGLAAIAMALHNDAGRDARLALAVLDLAAGDPARVPGRLEGLEIEPARRDALVLGAFTRLVNAGRYAEADGLAAAEDIGRLAMARAGDASRDARLALAVLDLAIGDPARVAGWIDGLEIESGRRRGLVLGAFTRLVNASRFAEALAMAGAEGIAGIAGTIADDAGRDARLALAVLDLAAGDPAQAPARLEGLDVGADRRRVLTLGAFTGLVNAGRLTEAIALRETAPIREWIADTSDAAGTDAVFSTIMLELAAGDPALVPGLLDTLPRLAAATREELLLQAFLRLAQKQRREEARDLAARRDIEAAALRAAPRLSEEALTALVLLDAAPDAAPGAAPDATPGGRSESPEARLVAWTEAGLDPALLDRLTILAFVSLVNAQAFAAAETLRRRIEPAFMGFAKAETASARDAGYALGVLHLQELRGEGTGQPHRAEAAFSAVRRGFGATLDQGDAAPPLFWEALRGELVALHRTQRGEEAAALARAMLARFQGAPDDLVRDFRATP